MIVDMPNVNSLPPCDTYDVAIYRSVEEVFPEKEHGRASRSADGRLFIKVEGTMLEYVVKSQAVELIGLSNADTGTMGDIGDEFEYSFKPTPTVPDVPTLPDIEDGEDIPELPTFDNPGAVMEGDEEEIGLSPFHEEDSAGIDEVITLPEGTVEEEDRELVEAKINEFNASLNIQGQLTFRRFLDTRPQWITITSVEATKMKGQVRGNIYNYEIVVYDDGKVALPDAAWTEFPQWMSFRHEK